MFVCTDDQRSFLRIQFHVDFRVIPKVGVGKLAQRLQHFRADAHQFILCEINHSQVLHVVEKVVGQRFEVLKSGQVFLRDFFQTTLERFQFGENLVRKIFDSFVSEIDEIVNLLGYRNDFFDYLFVINLTIKLTTENVSVDLRPQLKQLHDITALCINFNINDIVRSRWSDVDDRHGQSQLLGLQHNSVAAENCQA